MKIRKPLLTIKISAPKIRISIVGSSEPETGGVSDVASQSKSVEQESTPNPTTEVQALLTHAKCDVSADGVAELKGKSASPVATVKLRVIV